MHEPPKWYDANAKDNPPWIDALAKVRTLACRQGWCYQYVHVISLRLISTQRARWATANTFWTSPIQSGAAVGAITFPDSIPLK
jgi:hypothetical protein